jgi:hypothetical protein
MRTTILFLVALVPSLSSCQKSVSTKAVIVDTKSKFDFPDENKFWQSDKDTVRSGIVRNNEEIGRMWYTKGELKGDTTLVKIFSSNEVYIHCYLIKIFNGMCTVDYQFEMDVDDATKEIDRKIVPIEFLVKLNSLDFKKGREIRGYTEFKGKCSGEDCHGDTNIEIKGNFKVLID